MQHGMLGVGLGVTMTVKTLPDFWLNSRNMPIDVKMCAIKHCIDDRAENSPYCAFHLNPKRPPKKVRVDAYAGYTWIYFMECGKFIKIGRAINPRTRLGGIQSGCPYPIKFLAAFEGEEAMEKEMQDSFIDCHHRGEWYHATDDLYAFVGAVKKGAVEEIYSGATGRVLLPESFYAEP